MSFYINDTEIASSLSPDESTGSLEVTVKIAGDFEGDEGIYAKHPKYLCAYLTAGDGTEADRIYPAVMEAEVQFCMRVDDPVLWNAEYPYTYTLVTEIVDDRDRVLNRRETVTAFRHWEIIDGDTCLNKRKITFRTTAYPAGLTDHSQIEKLLGRMKHEYRNALLISESEKTAFLENACIRYGIYLITEGEHVESGRLLARREWGTEEEVTGDDATANPDFELQLVQTGVLIENRSIFANASEYDLYYEVTGVNGYRSSGTFPADVPAGTSRFIDIPFDRPEEAGGYRYFAALRLKEDTAWEKAGYEIVKAEKTILNIYER